MHPAISYELATARITDLHRQAQRDALARAAAVVPSGAAQGSNRIPVSLRRAIRRRRLGEQLWTLLHAQALLDGPAAAAGSADGLKDGYRGFDARRRTR